MAKVSLWFVAGSFRFTALDLTARFTEPRASRLHGLPGIIPENPHRSEWPLAGTHP